MGNSCDISKQLLSMSADELNQEFGVVKMNGIIKYNDKLYNHFKELIISNSSSRVHGTGLGVRQAISDTLSLLVDAGKITVNEWSTC